MSISFIVATACRPTVAATLKSIECWPGDEILLVSDENHYLQAQEFVRSNPFVRHLHHVAGNDWGHTERNFAMPHAKGDYIAHIDDDDAYVPGHRAIMQAAIDRHPGRPLIFRMRYHHGAELWRHKIAEVGNVGTPMSLLPNNGHQGRFGSFYGGDIEYLDSYAAPQGYSSDDYIWCEDVIVLIRPHLAARSSRHEEGAFRRPGAAQV